MTGRLLEAMAHAGARRYGGEPVSELAHALQCAELAAAAGADEHLTLACLLHDVGRVVVDPALVFDRVGGARPGTRGHHEIGAELIAPYVPERVAWLVRMHADAKRYLCSTDPIPLTRRSWFSQNASSMNGSALPAVRQAPPYRSMQQASHISRSYGRRSGHSQTPAFSVRSASDESQSNNRATGNSFYFSRRAGTRPAKDKNRPRQCQ
jgi:predicted HD phosphohydrolase